jgi:hypothetical protein
MPNSRRLLAAALALTAVVSAAAAEAPRFLDAQRELTRRFGPDLPGRSTDEIAAAIVELAEGLPVGGAIHLPESFDCGTLDFRRVADDVQITGGRGGTVILGGAPYGQAGIQLLFCRLEQRIAPGLPRPAAKVRAAAALGLAEFKDVKLFDKDARPATDLLALFCEGGMKINADVRGCAWIAGSNAFGKKTVTADARVDDSLFLWFGVNWPFADYNGHLDPKNKNRDWLDNAQMVWDLKGGGAGTRCYLMVETNYGNPGPGVILRNCKGLSLYHGSTERASSQGPGVYWLKDCEDVRLGLRRVFSATRGGPRGVLPTHDITVEGGRGNVLHNVECYGNSQLETVVNSDPALQVWSLGTDFANKGLDAPGILKFAYTPELNRPVGADLDALKARLPGLIDAKLKLLRLDPAEENRRRLEESFLSGRDAWNRLNATREITFEWGGADLTKAAAPTPVPPPPSMPATDAPRLRRPVEFARQPEFGKALLSAGADPSGARPSDDAFAQLMFGMTRDQVQAVLEETYKADADFRAARAAKDDAGMKAARDRLDAAYAKLHPPDPSAKFDPKSKKPRPRVKRGRIEVPAGTFLLTRPLVLTGGWGTLWGAGPDKTVIKAGGDFKVIEQHEKGDVCNLAVEGGRVGLAFTGADHSDAVSPTLHAYVAGRNYYNITFRGQSFAGIHVGTDDPELLGGSEHDQNKYVDLKFVDTGEYGIYMNQTMLDKWLLLHAEFRGQKKAGVSIKFNNLIHGGIIGCTFADIAGPAIDLMGGNPEILFRSHQVMVDQCEFTECGSASAPAVDQGAGVCMSFTRCRIVTKGKEIKAGYMGGPQIVEDVTVDVRTVGGGPAVVLRGVRQNQTARANGHMLRGVRSTGGLAFVNDANAYNDFFLKACRARGYKTDLNWDCNPAAHELKPAGGWTHPFVLYDCTFADKRFAYSLLNVDTDSGKVLHEIALPVARP